eukprot:9503771-Pyramimonas_sp.AAC.3
MHTRGMEGGVGGLCGRYQLRKTMGADRIEWTRVGGPVNARRPRSRNKEQIQQKRVLDLHRAVGSLTWPRPI